MPAKANEPTTINPKKAKALTQKPQSPTAKKLAAKKSAAAAADTKAGAAKSQAGSKKKKVLDVSEMAPRERKKKFSAPARLHVRFSGSGNMSRVASTE